MKTVAGANEFSTLIIPNLKIHINTEHNALIKAIEKVVLEHCEEGHHNRFRQFMRDGANMKKQRETSRHGHAIC